MGIVTITVSIYLHIFHNGGLRWLCFERFIELAVGFVVENHEDDVQKVEK